MSSQQNTSIDNELFHSYTQYKLCKVEKSNELTKSEKAAIITILKNFQFVDGNTLRSILNDAFQHSSVGNSYPFGNRADAVHDASSSTHNEILDSITDMIDLTIDGEDSSSSEPAYSELVYRKPNSGESSDDAFDYEREDSSNLNGSFNRKRQHSSLKRNKGKQPAEDLDMQGILSHEAFIQLGNMLRQIDQSKRTLCDRIKAVNDSFEIQTTFPTSGTSSFDQPETFKINRHFHRQSRLNQSQEHLAAYKIGKLVQRDKTLFPPDGVYNNMKRYYNSLIKKMKFYSHSHKQDFSQFPKYCERVVSLVDKTGLYTIFIPEILPPSRVKIASPENFKKLEKYLNERCSCFKSVAQFNEYGGLNIDEGKDRFVEDVGHSNS
ncbi:hypothetical protein PS15m_010938 [Mucor circinelloides]